MKKRLYPLAVLAMWLYLTFHIVKGIMEELIELFN